MIRSRSELFSALHARAYEMMEMGIPVDADTLGRVAASVSDLPAKIRADEVEIVLCRVENEMFSSTQTAD